ncbi:UDP-N-acetylmuramoyl-L-alanine--D-glutamate ligase [Leptobacterium sp. I13]|uniref:UDP-N-acetylmuramoyl-L-alanine--D-glutamate ligase n=1 Tax=Leptobacterium meishanense TaxID=3128904 RepID=UPI0030ED6057
MENNGPERKKRLVILGAGESGVGTAILGKKKEYEVFVSDKGNITEKYKNVLKHFEIDWEEGHHTKEKIFNADIVMKSPGIPDTIPLVEELHKRGVPVISEIEFASQYTDALLIGITGSNGKTTTTMLTYHILEQAGLDVGMAGNIGDSFAQMVAETAKENYVLEVSSFQLDGTINFKPHIAVITNITPDHLDRYDNNFENYINSKFRITMNQTAEDYLIYDADDDVITEWLADHKTKAVHIPFSINKKLERGIYLENKNIIVKISEKPYTMATETIALEGKHNIKNAMAASAVAHILRIRKQTIRESLENFQGAEHRLEKTFKINKVQYINDSKATNVNATYYALDSMTRPTVWIVGGEDKGNDYTSLMPLVREKVKAIICLGLDNSKIIEAFGNITDLMIETFSMEEAVKVAYNIAEKGDNVLLSPACASFDLFKNYEDRGQQFKEAIRKL